MRAPFAAGAAQPAGSAKAAAATRLRARMRAARRGERRRFRCLRVEFRRRRRR